MQIAPIFSNAFFYCVFFFFINSFYINAQIEKDSIAYHYRLATNPKTTNDLPKSYVFFKRKKAQSVQKNDSSRVVYYLRLITSIERKLGAFYDSELSAIEALRLLTTKERDREAKIGLYNHLGMLHREQQNYKDALLYYNKIIDIANKPSDSSAFFNNKGVLSRYQEKYHHAIDEFQKAYEINIRIQDSIEIAKTLDNLGYVQSKLYITEGLSNMLQALAIRKKLNINQYPSYQHLSEYYRDRADTLQAIQYVKKAYTIAKTINSASYKQDALSRLVDLGVSSYFKEYKQLTDSITEANKLQENKFAAAKYNVQEEKKIARQNKLEKEQEQQLRILYQILGVLLLLLSIAIYLVIQSRHKKEKVTQVLKTEARISKKVHDEVANDMYLVMNKLQSNSHSKEAILDDLELIYDKTRDISKENSTVEVEENFEELLFDLLGTYKNEQTVVLTKGIQKIVWQKIPNLQKSMLYRVLQELMTNMKKHSEASRVTLDFFQLQKKLHVVYKDNGVGCELRKRNGLFNTETRMASVGGKITFESKPNSGFSATLKI